MMRERPAVDYPDDPPWPELIAAHVAGDRAATEDLARGLGALLRVTADTMLGEGDRDGDDVVSESVVAVLDYLQRNPDFQGNLPRFAIAVTRNRCRNILAARRRRSEVHLEPLLEWYDNPERNPLDLLEEKETCALVQEALARLDAACAHLLRACYLEGVSIAALREQLGLETIQGVYYRRAKCLQKAFRHLNKRLLVCSPGAAEGTAEGSPRGGDPRA